MGATNTNDRRRLVTAKTHVSRLLMKLSAPVRAELVVIAYEPGLVSTG